MQNERTSDLNNSKNNDNNKNGNDKIIIQDKHTGVLKIFNNDNDSNNNGSDDIDHAKRTYRGP